LGIKSVSNEKTVKLIDDLIQSFNSKFCVPKDINTIPKGINGIIYEKFYTSSNKGLNLAIENSIYSDLLDVLKPKTFNNLCEILGVVVDNAIEASSSGTEKAILIDFAEDKNTININISNTFNSELDIDMLGEKNYSTKGTSRGIGLFSILRKKDIKVKSRIINNLYQTNLIIKKTVQ